MPLIAQKNLVKSQAELARLLDYSRPRITQLKNKNVLVFNRKGQFDKSHATNRAFIKKWELENGKPFPKVPPKPDMRRSENRNKAVAPQKKAPKKAPKKEEIKPPPKPIITHDYDDDEIMGCDIDLDRLDEQPLAVQKLGWEIKVKKEQHEKLEIENERKRGEVLPREETLKTFEYVFSTIDKILRDLPTNGMGEAVVRQMNELKEETRRTRILKTNELLNSLIGAGLKNAYEVLKQNTEKLDDVEL